jgi:hypothetical protein
MQAQSTKTANWVPGVVGRWLEARPWCRRDPFSTETRSCCEEKGKVIDMKLFGLLAIAASAGVNSPVATASTMAPDAFTASDGVSSLGSANITGRSFRAGAIHSRHRRMAVKSPALASSIALRVSA